MAYMNTQRKLVSLIAPSEDGARKSILKEWNATELAVPGVFLRIPNLRHLEIRNESNYKTVVKHNMNMEIGLSKSFPY